MYVEDISTQRTIRGLFRLPLSVVFCFVLFCFVFPLTENEGTEDRIGLRYTYSIPTYGDIIAVGRDESASR